MASSTRQCMVTPICESYKKTGIDSRRDWEDQEARERAGEQMNWDGLPPSKSGRKMSKGDVLAIVYNKTKRDKGEW